MSVLVVLAAILGVVIFIAYPHRDILSVSTGGDKSFLGQFVVGGGPIVWFILLPMSLLTVYLAVEYSFIIRRAKLLPIGITEKIIELIKKHDNTQLQEKLTACNDLISTAVADAFRRGKDDRFRIRSGVNESLQDQALELVRRIEWINLIGNVSPMVGLFGTVFGMIKLFNAIVIAGGQPQPAQLAEGISVALVTTFWGLLIAIPALAIHGIFQNRIETIISDAVIVAEDIMAEVFNDLQRIIKTDPVKKPKPSKDIAEISAKKTKVESVESLH